MARRPGHASRPHRRSSQNGLTLLELMVVLTLAAIATAAVALSLRDPDEQALTREAERLISRLEGARAWSRSSGQPVQWSARADAHLFSGPGPARPAEPWLNPGIEVQWIQSAAPGLLVLGPEPMLPAQVIGLKLRQHSLSIATDGLGPFELRRP